MDIDVCRWCIRFLMLICWRWSGSLPHTRFGCLFRGVNTCVCGNHIMNASKIRYTYIYAIHFCSLAEEIRMKKKNTRQFIVIWLSYIDPRIIHHFLCVDEVNGTLSNVWMYVCSEYHAICKKIKLNKRGTTKWSKLTKMYKLFVCIGLVRLVRIMWKCMYAARTQTNHFSMVIIILNWVIFTRTGLLLAYNSNNRTHTSSRSLSASNYGFVSSSCTRRKESAFSNLLFCPSVLKNRAAVNKISLCVWCANIQSAIHRHGCVHANSKAKEK